MPRLQSFRIWGCNKLKSLPDYLLTAPLLKKLEIYRSNLLQRHYQRGNKKNWHKISHISNIELGGVYVQRDGEPQFDSKVTLLSFLFFLYFIFSFQIYQLNINIWIGLWKQSGSLVYSNSPPPNVDFYAWIFYLFVKYINLIYKYMGFD